jgi:hypothetical protein
MTRTAGVGFRTRLGWIHLHLGSGDGRYRFVLGRFRVGNSMVCKWESPHMYCWISGIQFGHFLVYLSSGLFFAGVDGCGFPSIVRHLGETGCILPEDGRALGV